ncbi:MAG: sigma-70 family RNA polymerase sigma factor [Chloroflexi bacterium]|nr:sigma-70 family RNA polymerase sigma factor [Chloroflexota bacterium]
MHVDRRDTLLTDGELAQLIQRAQQKNAAALDQIYVAYADRVYRYFRYRVDDEMLSEDLTVEVFYRVFSKIETFRVTPQDTGAVFAGWIFRIAHNLVVDTYHKRSREEKIFIQEEFETVTATVSAEGDGGSTRLSAQPGLSMDQAFHFQELSAALRQLTADQQQVVLLRFFEEMGTAEIARIMNKTEGAIKALQHRALQTLQVVIQKNTGNLNKFTDRVESQEESSETATLSENRRGG